MVENIINGILLVGAIQGFIFGIAVLGSKKYRALSTYFLVALILIISYNNFQYFLSGLMGGDLLNKTIYLPMGILVPPIIYFYVTTFLDPKKKITRKEKLMYIPFLFFLVIALAYKILCLFDLGNEKIYEVFLYLSQLHEVISLLFIVTILAISTRLIYQFKTKVKPINHRHVQPAINWLLSIIIMLLAVMIIYAYFIFKLLTAEEGDDGTRYISFYTVWIASSILIYVLGHIGIYKFAIIEERRSIRRFIEASQTSPSTISKNSHIKKLEQVVSDNKRFLDSNISLEQLSEELQLSKSHLSRIINTELNMSFSDYVNSLRVEEAKKSLLNPEFSKYTLVSIGLESGFNSKTTFNNTFKKFTGQTPSQFRKSTKN